MYPVLPMPELRASEAAGISFLTDGPLEHACGVRIAFTGRSGGCSVGPYASLNLGDHVGDDPVAVDRNRQRLLEALGCADAQPITLNQVHGDDVLTVRSASAEELDHVRAEARAGADAVVVEARGVAPILCFADCVPVIIVAPSGAFAVAHAGWRGVMAGVAPKAAAMLAMAEVAQGAPSGEAALAAMNVYLGPHIGACCFQTGSDVRAEFRERFGDEVLAGPDRVDLSVALRLDLENVGVDPRRICDAGICTACDSEGYYSYRASGGTCGRHGAAALRKR